MIFEFFSSIKKEILNIDSMLNNSDIFNRNIVNSSIDKNILSGLNMGFSVDDQGNKQMTSGYSNAIEDLADYYSEATAQANALRMAQDGLTESTTKDILAKQNWSKAEIDAAISSEAFKTAQTNATIATKADTEVTLANVVATKALTVTKKALSVLGGIAFATAISIGVAALTKLADSLITTKAELEEAAESARQNIDDIKDSFDNLKNTTNDIKKRYAELAQGVYQLTGKNVKLSNDEYEEFLDLSNQLAGLFPTLTKNYDNNGNAILDLSGNVSNIISSLDDLIERQRQLSQEEMLENLPDIYKDYQGNIESYTKQLDEEKKKQDDYVRVYNQLKNSEYETSEDKKVVMFHFGNIDEKEKSKLAEELTSAFDDINDYIVQDIGTLENHDSTITLYLDKEFSGFDARLKSAQDEISEYSSKIKTEMSSFSSYMNTWLQESWEFQQVDDTKMQSALKKVLFNKDWLEVAKSELGNDAEWDEISTWIEDKYISAINSINNKEIKQSFIDLFTLDLTPQVQIELAQKIQDYFNENNILVSLDFILDGNDPSSTQSLVDRMNNSISELTVGDDRSAYELKKYVADFDDSQMNAWLEVTKGARNAGYAISLFEDHMESLSKEDIEFFTESNLEGIDSYKDKISDLGTYLESINNNHKLSAEEMVALNTVYGISASSVDEYKNKIIELMNEVVVSSDIMEALAEAIASCNDAAEKERLQSLYDNLSNLPTEVQESADEFGKLETSISSLQSKAELLRDINKGIREVGYIDSSKIDDIASAYPGLINEVAEYNAGLITSTELFNAVKEAYEKDEQNYKLSVAAKLQYNEEFYGDVQENISQELKDKAESYGIDFENYKNLLETKLALDKVYASKKVRLQLAIKKSDEAIEKAENARGHAKVLAEEEAVERYAQRLAAEKELTDVEKFINDFDTSISTTIDFDTSWDSFGTDKSEKEEIDWAEQSLSILQGEVDKLQTAFDNTKGINNQIEAIGKLNEALGKLKEGYNSAYGAYETKYNAELSKLGSSQESIRRKIESGEEFKLLEYDPETAEIIKNAIGYYNQMLETKVKINDITQQINENENVKKPQIKLAGYEAQLEVINSMMDDSSLTIAEQIKLLEKEMEIEASILEQELLLAETEEERLKLQEKYNKKAKETAEQKYQKKRTSVNNKVGYYDTRIQDIKDYIELVEEYGGQGSEKLYNAMNTYLQKQIDYEEVNYKNALAKRDASKWGTDAWTQYNEEIQEAQDKIHACTMAQIENNKAILLLPVKKYEELNEELQEELDILNEYQSKIDNAIGYASTLVQDQIDMLNDNKESVSDYWDNQIKDVQAEKDALTETNDELQRRISLENAEYALQKAMNNKTSRVYKKGQGFVYEADQEEIRSAQQELDKLQYENQIAELDKTIEIFNEKKEAEIEIIDAKIKAWDEYAEKINKVTDSYEKFISMQDLIQVFGSGSIANILNKDEEIVSDFESTLNAVKTEASEIEQKIEANEKLIETIQKEADEFLETSSNIEDAKKVIQEAIAYNTDEVKAIEQRSDMAKELSGSWSTTKDVITTVLSDIQEANNIAKDNEFTTLSERLENLKSFKDDAQDVYEDITQILKNAQSAIGSIEYLRNKTNDSSDSKFDSSRIPNFETTGLQLYHTGGVVGKNNKELPNTLVALTGENLKSNEVLAKLLNNEVVLTQPQVGNLFNNLGRAYGALIPSINTSNNSNGMSITIGDVNVYNPDNSDMIVNEIVKELPLKVIQRLNTK